MFKIKSLKKGRYMIPDQYCQAHELVRIKSGSQYMGIDGKLTTSKDEALLAHPDHADHIINQLSYRHKEFLFITETNRQAS